MSRQACIDVFSGALLRGRRASPAIRGLPESALLVATRPHRPLLLPLPLRAGRVRHVHRVGHHRHRQEQRPSTTIPYL